MDGFDKHNVTIMSVSTSVLVIVCNTVWNDARALGL